MGNIDLSFFNAQSVKGLYRSPWETNYQLWICCVYCLIYTKKINKNTHSKNKRINNVCLLCEKSFSFLLFFCFPFTHYIMFKLTQRLPQLVARSSLSNVARQAAKR
jgi:hypothetical protein